MGAVFVVLDMPQYIELAVLMGVHAGMLVLSGLGAFYVWREGEDGFFRLWFEAFSKWLGATTLFGLFVFTLNEYPVIIGVIFWGGVLFLIFGWWVDRQGK